MLIKIRKTLFEFLGCKKKYNFFCTENPMDFLVIQNLKDLWTCSIEYN